MAVLAGCATEATPGATPSGSSGSTATLAPGGPALPRSAQDFPDGVIAGDPRPDGTIIWTRVAPALGAVELRWEVAEDQDMARVVKQGRVRADERADLTARVAVEGLQSDRWYHYRFSGPTTSSPVGRLRTAPPLGSEVKSLRFAFSSCQQITDSLYVAHRAAADEPDLDFFMHLGDYIYVHDQKTLTLDDYRGVYHRFKANPLLQDLQAKVPLVAMLDDGEFYNGIDRTAPPDRWRAARRAWAETMPVPLSDDDQPFYRRFAWGNLVDLFMLDVRSYRDPAVEADDTSTPEGAVMLAEGRTTLGAEQKAWLVEGLKASNTSWRFLGNPYNMSMVRISDADPGPPRAPGVQVNGGTYFPNEAWDDYSAERREILQAIVDDHVRDVVSVSGHTHVWIAGRLKADFDDDAAPVAGFDFTCGSLTADPDVLHVEGSTAEKERAKNQALAQVGQQINQHLRYLNLIDQGYGLVTVTPEQVVVEFKLIDTYDEHAQAKVGARFVVPRRADDMSVERFADAER
jgi:alkaline phosphatase D